MSDHTATPVLPAYMTKLHVPGQRDAGKPTIILPFELLSTAQLAEPSRPTGSTAVTAAQKLAKG